MSSPDVVLIVPPGNRGIESRSYKYNRMFPPLALLNLASSLRAGGHRVQVFDLRASPGQKGDCLRAAASAGWSVLSTSPYADWQCPSMEIDAAVQLARELPSDRLLLTGHHATHYPEPLLKETGALAAVRRQPEKSVPGILAGLRDGQPLDKLPSVSFMRNGQAVHVPDQPRKIRDALSLVPAYDLVDLDHYRYEVLGRRLGLVEASRGCPFSCNFCNLSMFDGRYEKLDTEVVLRTLDHLVKQAGARTIYFFDLEFTVNRKMAEAVCRHILDEGYFRDHRITWTCQTRADSVDAPLLALMKRAGCRLIHFGIESGNPEILARTNKRITLEKIAEGVNLARRAGIRTAGFFMFGHPGETADQMEETIRFSRRLSLDLASFHPLLLIPGSPLFTAKHGPGPYEVHWKSHTSQGQEEAAAIHHVIRKAYLAFYSRPGSLFHLLRLLPPSLYLQQVNLFRRVLFN